MKQLSLSLPPASILDESFEECLRNSRLRAIEYSRGGVSWEELADLKETRPCADKMRELHQKGLLDVPSIHLPFWPEPWSFTSPDEAVRADSIKATQIYLSAFEGLPFQNLTIHCGAEFTSTDPEFRKKNIRQMKRSCHDLLPLCEKYHASLNLEFLPRLCIGNHEDELLDIIADFPPEFINLNLDVNHLMGRAAELPDIIRQCAPRIRALHLSDYDAIDECHWQLGHGVIDWTAVLNAIDELPDNVLLINETSPLLRKPKENYRPTPLAVRLRSAEADFVRLLCAREWDALAKRVFPGK